MFDLTSKRSFPEPMWGLNVIARCVKCWIAGPSRPRSPAHSAALLAIFTFPLLWLTICSSARDEVIADHGPAHVFAQLDLRFVFLELAAADQHAAALDLDRGAALALVVPLHEGAIAEADGSVAGDARDLIARAPEGTVDESH